MPGTSNPIPILFSKIKGMFSTKMSIDGGWSCYSWQKPTIWPYCGFVSVCKLHKLFIMITSFHQERRVYSWNWNHYIWILAALVGLKGDRWQHQPPTLNLPALCAGPEDIRHQYSALFWEIKSWIIFCKIITLFVQVLHQERSLMSRKRSPLPNSCSSLKRGWL